MKTTPKALKDLFVALGGDPSAVDSLLTVDVLNAIAEKYQGEGDATRIPDAIDAITAVADNIGGEGGGGETASKTTINVLNSSGGKFSVYGLNESLQVHIYPDIENNRSIECYSPSRNLKYTVPIVLSGSSLSLKGFTVTSGAAVVSCLYSDDGTTAAVFVVQDNHAGDSINLEVKQRSN